MQKLALAVALVAVWSVTACEKTGRGEYEIERPVVGTETDTVRTPTIETGTVRDTIKVPEVDIKTEKKEVKLPKVEIKKPAER